LETDHPSPLASYGEDGWSVFFYLNEKDESVLEYAVVFTAVLVCVLSVYTCLGDMNDVS